MKPIPGTPLLIKNLRLDIPETKVKLKKKVFYGNKNYVTIKRLSVI